MKMKGPEESQKIAVRQNQMIQKDLAEVMDKKRPNSQIHAIMWEKWLFCKHLFVKLVFNEKIGVY